MVDHKEASDHNLQLMKHVREEQYRTAQLTRGKRSCSTVCSACCDTEPVADGFGVGSVWCPLGYQYHVLFFLLLLKCFPCWHTQTLSSSFPSAYLRRMGACLCLLEEHLPKSRPPLSSVGLHEHPSGPQVCQVYFQDIEVFAVLSTPLVNKNITVCPFYHDLRCLIEGNI